MAVCLSSILRKDGYAVRSDRQYGVPDHHRSATIPSAFPLAESDTIEFKASWVEDALEDLAAFANTRGGTLYLGVNDAGKILGCDVGDVTQQRIGAKIRNILQIAADLRVIAAQSAGGLRPVLAITVQRSRSPVLLRGSYWTRMGTISIKATPEQWTDLVLAQIGRSWDALPVRRGLKRTDIDGAALATYIRSAQAHAKPRLPADLPAEAPLEVILATLGLYTDGELTNAAILLFGKAPHQVFRNARVRIARFRGHGVDDVSEHVPLVGGALDQINGAVRILEEYIPARWVMPGTPGNQNEAIRRRDIPEYPVSVLREAVTNAVIHRDYTSPDDIQIRVLDDRFEIWNPGGLLPGLTIPELYRSPHESKRRNPLIADAAFFAQVIERWGTGTSRMVKTCEAADVPSPEFAERGGGFLVILRKDSWTPARLAARGLSERQIAGVMHVLQVGGITNREYRQLTGLKDRSAAEDLRKLVELGILQRSSATGRGTRYVLGRPRNPQNSN